MPRIKFTVSYDGTDFCGWQRQNHEQKPSVCQTLQEALEKVFHHPVSLFASGRTDAGVHALNQVCHFDTDRSESSLLGWDLGWALRPKLPSTIVVKKAWLAPQEFHSTLSAEKKTYRYFIYNSQRPSAHLSRYMGWVRQPLNLDLLNQMSQTITGEHDFKSYQSVGTDVPHTVRTVYNAHWVWRRPNVAQFTITGSGFLKQMVRNIVGTQLLAHRKEWGVPQYEKVLAGQDRRLAGAPAEPQGLYLLRVYYPQDLDNKCREL